MQTTFFGYGFEYNDKNFNCEGLTLCKSFLNGVPVYCSILLEGPNLFSVMDRIETEEKNFPEKINLANTEANQKNVRAEWQKVYCSENLIFQDNDFYIGKNDIEKMEM